MSPPVGYVVTGRHGTPWRIPGTELVRSIPAGDLTSPAAAGHIGDLENACPDGDACPGASAHAPDQTIKLERLAPLPAALAISTGRH